jgi:hypothetical protein
MHSVAAVVVLPLLAVAAVAEEESQVLVLMSVMRPGAVMVGRPAADLVEHLQL